MVEYGLQLWSVRDSLEQDFKGTIKKIAEIGYKKVETAGFYGLTSEEFYAIINDAGLTVSAAHLGLHHLENDYKGIVNYVKGIKCENYIIAGADFSADAFDNTIDLFNKYQAMLEADGINFQFHNHAPDFINKNSEGLNAMEAILAKTKLNIEVDTYWAFVAKVDPIKYITEHADRIKFIHLKDGSPDGNGTILGRGSAPVAAVHETALKLGFDMIVESENQDPDGITEVTESFKFVSSL